MNGAVNKSNRRQREVPLAAAATVLQLVGRWEAPCRWWLPAGGGMRTWLHAPLPVRSVDGGGGAPEVPCAPVTPWLSRSRQL
ncbi:unnamed protein product [Parnassius apollo]|uniref:(apollo) hypothetical protein n=1 Tax=Parnassius apollo TaxID=110799 RepID=A0A8S3Y6J8_PARAO|nr:unnamed protein product [Parnassius apollo]